MRFNQRKEKEEFERILEKAKKLDRPNDVLVPLSWAKDSTYALYLCTKVYGLRTLSVTFDNGFLTQLTKENIRNALESCNADHIFYKIGHKKSSKLI